VAFYRSRSTKSGEVREGITDNKTVESPPILQVVREEGRAARAPSRLDQQRVPKRDLVKAVNVDRTQHIIDGDEHDLKLCEELDFSARGGGGHLQLLCGCREVFFERLGGHERVPIGVARFDQRERDCLFVGRVVIVGVDEDVRVQELSAVR
jgi:hypothetical protein